MLRSCEKILAGMFLAAGVAAGWAAPALSLIPQPANLKKTPGAFTLNPAAAIAADAQFAPVVEVIAASLRAQTGLPLPLRNDGQIRFVVSSPLLPPEAYGLDVTSRGIVITASTPAGAFYGGQSLRQLVNGHTVPAVAINDYPRFSWRGLMLDCSRTFQSVAYLQQTIDRLAAYKMNVLHLHLTDDQGWRLEIRQHPELTRVGARFSPQYNEPEAHQGFYTQSEIRELLAYAAARHVTLVPEIEMPGHSHEVLVCHPELACRQDFPREIFPFGKGKVFAHSTLCAGNDDTLRLMEEVLDEVIELFPSPFIHVGGDEAIKNDWKKCPKCQARMIAEGLKNEEELQSYFMRRIEKYVTGKGRRLIGWSEILQGGLAPNAALMDWKGGAEAATQSGHDVVMAPNSCYYLSRGNRVLMGERTYRYEPTAKLSPDQAGHLLGLEACFWSHLQREPAGVDRLLFPRLLAVAERAWSPASAQDWPAFKKRADAQRPLLRRLGLESNLELIGSWSPQTITTNYQTLTWNVTEQLKTNGACVVTFQYTQGRCRLGIESAELLADGAVLCADTHRGVTGAIHKDNTYTLALPQLRPNARYELRASVRAEGGSDSAGEVWLTIKENKPSPQ